MKFLARFSNWDISIHLNKRFQISQHIGDSYLGIKLMPNHKMEVSCDP